MYQFFLLLIHHSNFDEELGVIAIIVQVESNVQYHARHKKIVLCQCFISALLVWCVISTVPQLFAKMVTHID